MQESRSVDQRLGELEASRRRHRWAFIVLVLAWFTTCGNVQRLTDDVDSFRDQVQQVQRARSD